MLLIYIEWRRTMQKKWWMWIVLGIIIAVVVSIGIVIAMTKNPKEQKENGNFKIVTSFYPVYIMTINITQGAQNIEVMNLTQNNVGCLHDYTLAASDMRKVENADVFIQNGFGLENFANKIISTYPNLKIVDSSTNVMGRVEGKEGTNPHIWTSVENYTKQVQLITEKLIEYNPENVQVYKQNSETYLKALNDLKLRYSTELHHLNGKKAVILNEALTYLAKDLQMQTIEIVTNHEESTLSAEIIRNTIEKMKQENIKIILVGAEDDLKNAQTLANETGAKIYKLETGLTGTTSKDAYLNSMIGNLEILKQIQEF